MGKEDNMNRDEEHAPVGSRLVFLLLVLAAYLLGGGALPLVTVIQGIPAPRQMGTALQLSGTFFALLSLLALLGMATASSGPRGKVLQRTALQPKLYLSAAAIGFLLVILTGILLEW